MENPENSHSFSDFTLGASGAPAAAGVAEASAPGTWEPVTADFVALVISCLVSLGILGGAVVVSMRPSPAATNKAYQLAVLVPTWFICSEDILGFPLPLFVAIVARAVFNKGRLGETDRTRSARTASLNVVLKADC